MSKESAKKFLNMLNEDPDFKREIEQAKSHEEAKVIFEAHGLSFTKEEYLEAYQNQLGRKLSEHELETVVAGRNGPPMAYFS